MIVLGPRLDGSIKPNGLFSTSFPPYDYHVWKTKPMLVSANLAIN